MNDEKPSTIYELLSAQTERAPSAVAIGAPGRSALTYRGLLSQVDAVVKSLKIRGVHRSDRVAVVMPNGPDMAVAFLGVTAGAVCAPLNPACGRSEFEFYLSELNPKTLVVQSGMNSAVIALAENRAVPIIEVLPKPEASAGIFIIKDNKQPATSTVDSPRADDIALILPTSGTTSRPKMVPLSHANLLASAGNIAATLRLSEADRCLNVMPLFHIHGLVGALLSSVAAGASVICSSGFDIEQFFPWLVSLLPTWYTAVPTIHHAVLARAQSLSLASRNHSLRFIRSSSSALPARVMQGLEEIFQVPVIESYGMTEAAHQMTSNPLPPGQRKVGSVGLAAGPEVSIMDEAGRVLSNGEIGEIVIRGANVMHGYDNNSDANGKAFAQGWFRTGDQGYQDREDYLFITGRLKEIINRGGEKISPREVDEVILQHPAVAEATSFALPHETLGEDIAAAVVIRDKAAVTESDLQRFVAAQLAEFKIPRRVLLVDEIPKSATGKPQRTDLAKKFGALLLEQRIHEFLAPKTQTEKTLAAIWSEILGVEQIGVQDNFFYLGGDSICAAQVISRVRDTLHAELSFLIFFEAPTIVGIAARIDSVNKEGQTLKTLPISPVSRVGELPVSFAQQSLWLFDQLEPNSSPYNIPAAFRLSGPLDVRALEQTLNEIVQRHEPLRTTFTVLNGRPVQVIAPARTLTLPVMDLQTVTKADQETEVRQLATEEAQKPFDLARGPLLRVSLIRLGEQKYVLFLTMHHIISDGWSMRILFREISALYAARCTGSSFALPELSFQYADFAVWQRQCLQGDVLREQLAYWKTHLGGAPPVLELPTDRPRLSLQTFRGDAQLFQFSLDLTRKLKTLSQQSGATLYMTLLGGFVSLLSRYSAQKDIVVGSSFANRHFRELESLIGLFVDTLVMRIDLSGNPTFKELLARVKQIVLGAFAHQKLPFEKLVEELQPERNLTRNPLFQVFFVFQNAPEHRLELPRVTITRLKIENPTAKFDLMLSIEETTQGLRGRLEYNSDLFNAPAIARMSQRFEALVESIVGNPDAALCDLQIDRELDLQSLSPSVKAGNEAPLSYHQERLWFIDQFETGHVYESSPTYHNIPLILHVSGPIDCVVLEQSLNVIVKRHSALRTRIVCRNGRSLQVISPEENLKLKVVDGISKGTTMDGVLESALDDSRRPFTMNGELLARATLFRMTAVESLLIVTVHHIVADKQSLQIIAEELAEVYDARTTGRAPQLAELILQYTDYARWQLALPANILEYLLFYWKYQLGGKLQAIELPSDRLRPAIQTFTDARYTFSLARELTQRIRTLSRKQHSFEFAVLLAGFKALLHRYTGQDEIVVGISEPCRNQPGIKNVVGPIANLLVLRSTLGNLPFRSLLEQVTKTLNQAWKHQEMPFDKLVQELKPEKDMSRTALFDVLFQFEDRQRAILNMGDMKARVIDTNFGYGKYDINLSMQGAEEELSGIVVYNRDIYDAFTIEQMMRHFEVILDAMTCDQDQRIGDVVLLSKVEQHQQLVTWNSTQASYPMNKTIHQLFEEQAEKTPENTAVICGAEGLTYRELDARANQLAHYLRKQGVASDTLVALELDRSPEILIACLGVLKAGGAYLPMDPAYPDEQLRFMLKDARISHLITTEALLRNIPENPPSVTLLDSDRERISAQPAVAPAHNGSPKDLAYCIYTSGSTGKPKGVLLEHRNVVRLLVNNKLRFTFTESDVWTMFHSYCFDFSVWEMYGALLYGGKLVIVPNQVTRDPSAFLDMLVLERVTVLNQTPTFFYHLLQKTVDRLKADLALRYVIFGGEALDPTRLKPWKKTYPDTKLINMYGITETTVHVTFKEITDTDTQEKVSNIGVPIPTTTTYVMDSNLRLLPVGVPGEVYVGGDGVARGYLSRDELTRQKFLQNPYKPEERVYRSGDLAKLLPNGEMVYLGRMDDQVQIRGFRVELGAIQSYLLAHPSVAEAVVVATNLQSSAIEIVAYIVQRADIIVTALREHLAQTLPYYMMPSAFVFLEALPLTPNGKVDRRALPAPDGERPDLEEIFLAPNTLTEKMLAGIWSEILRVEPVGVHDNFFEIGGHSLLIVQVQRRLCEILDHDVSVVDLFRHPTISSLASFLSQNKIEPSQVNAIEERAQRRKEAMARRKRLSKDDGEIQ